MFDLWGPIIHEYYAGTEGNGFVYCTPEDWLAHPGTGPTPRPPHTGPRWVIEDCLIMPPKVADVAVFAVPNTDLGEEVRAVVQPELGIEPSPGLGQELLAYASDHIARFKVPRSVDFRDDCRGFPSASYTNDCAATSTGPNNLRSDEISPGLQSSTTNCNNG